MTRCEPGGPAGLQLPVWDLFVVDAAWDALHRDVMANVEVDAQLCIAGELEPIELELQGTSGRTRDKKSFKIKLERDHALGDVGFEADSDELIDKVYLKAVYIDPSMIREAVAFDLWRELGYDAPRTSFANLRINGDYWGLYEVLEPVDADYLRRNGYPSGGRLYKGTRKHGSRADFAPGRDLQRAFEDKTGGDDDGERDDLARLLRTLQKTPLDPAAFRRDIDPIFPLDDYIDRLVWVSFTRNGDAVAQNFFLYNAPREGHDFWQQIVWDSDLCMGANWRDRDAVVASDVSLLLDGGNYFGERLTSVPMLRERYAERFRQVLDEMLTEHVVLSHVERRAARVRHDLAEDQLRWQRNGTPEEAFEVIRRFIAERPEHLRRGLDEMFGPPQDSTEPTGDHFAPDPD
ncbi:MAG TPA: CotH kinase family protein [Polyangiales bacterium]|nr:CotH kinase family protein [Polyangiales bacterium]